MGSSLFSTTPYIPIYSFGSVYSKKACLTAMATAICGGGGNSSSSSSSSLGRECEQFQDFDFEAAFFALSRTRNKGAVLN